MAHQHHSDHAHQRQPGRSRELCEIGCAVLDGIHLSGKSRDEVLKRPAGHYGIVAEDEPRGEDAQVALQHPPRAGCQLTISVGRVLVGVADILVPAYCKVCGK